MTDQEVMQALLRLDEDWRRASAADATILAYNSFTSLLEIAKAAAFVIDGMARDKWTQLEKVEGGFALHQALRQLLLPQKHSDEQEI